MKTLTKLTDKKLTSLKGTSKLKNAVIDMIISRPQSERIHFITDTLKHGCVSGIVGELCYYSGTGKFYDEHQDEIFELAQDQAEDFGWKNANALFSNLSGADKIASLEQDKNLKAWYGFEETLRSIADFLDFEI